MAPEDGLVREMLAEGQERGALRLFGRRELLPLRAADGTEEDGVRGAAGLEGRVRQSLTMVVDARATHVVRGMLEGVA